MPIGSLPVSVTGLRVGPHLPSRLSASRAVAVATIALTAAAVGYTLRYGSNAPVMDEWDIVPQLGEMTADGAPLDWLTVRHNEHRYLPGRMLYLALMTASGFDFRWGMVASAVLLGLAATVFAAAARQARGRAEWSDLVLPAALLNWGHGFNVLMGYQVAFSLFTLTAAGLVWVIVTDRGGWRWDLAAAASLLGMMLHGGMGLALVPPVGAWLVYRAWASRATGSGPGWRAGVAGGAVLVAVAYTIWCMTGVERTSEPKFRLGGWMLASAGGQFLAMGLGLWPTGAWWRTGMWASAAGIGATSLILIGAFVRRPDERVRVAGLLAVLAGVLMMAVGIAWGRGFGLAERYPTLSCVWVATAAVAAARYGPPLPGRLAVGLWVAAAVALVAVNYRPGWRYGTVHRMYYRELDAAVRAGLSPRFVADRFRGPFLDDDRFAFRLDEFRRFRLGALQHLAADPPMTAVPVPHPPHLPPCSPEEFAAGPGGVAIPPPPPGRHAVGLRVDFELDQYPGLLRLNLAWTGADGHPRTAFVYPGWRAGRQALAFWVDDRPTEVRLLPGTPTLGAVIHKVEWLVAADPR